MNKPVKKDIINIMQTLIRREGEERRERARKGKEGKND